MSLEELRSITIRQFFLMVERLKDLDRPRDSTLEGMLGQLLAMVGNIGYTGLAKPLQAEDFMPSVWAKKASRELNHGKPPRKPRMTKAKKIALAAQFREAFMHFVAK